MAEENSGENNVNAGGVDNPGVPILPSGPPEPILCPPGPVEKAITRFVVFVAKALVAIPCILLVLWILFGFTGLTQGAISSAVSKAFSAVVSQTTRLKQLEEKEKQR